MNHSTSTAEMHSTVFQVPVQNHQKSFWLSVGWCLSKTCSNSATLLPGMGGLSPSYPLSSPLHLCSDFSCFTERPPYSKRTKADMHLAHDAEELPSHSLTQSCGSGNRVCAVFTMGKSPSVTLGRTIWISSMSCHCWATSESASSSQKCWGNSPHVEEPCAEKCWPTELALLSASVSVLRTVENRGGLWGAPETLDLSPLWHTYQLWCF